MKQVGFQLAGTVSGQAVFDKPVRPAALCRGVTTEMKKDMRLTEKRSQQRQIGE